MVKPAKDTWASGSDAAYIKPKMVPNDELLARDDSGGPDYQPYTAAFGDGGYVTGEKPHLSAHGEGMEDEVEGDEIPSTNAARNKNVSPKAPKSSTKEAEE